MKIKPSGTFSHSSVLRSSSSPELQSPKNVFFLVCMQRTFCHLFGTRRARTLDASLRIAGSVRCTPGSVTSPCRYRRRGRRLDQQFILPTTCES
ncbi:uncharacterized protein RHO25_002490 [Cercospora beticola]|nr:hypothetical protein RHO25_002490 [Cercospora beticola]